MAAIDGEVMTSELVDFVRRMDKCIQKDSHHLGLPDVIPISPIIVHLNGQVIISVCSYIV